MSQYIPKIAKVENNIEKYLSMKDMIIKYTKAYKYECYYECLWLTYALLEDRTEALFYYIGFLNKNRDGVISNKKIKKFIKRVLLIDNTNPRYNFDKLYYKLDHIIKLIGWINNSDSFNDEYEKELRKVLKKYLDNDELINTINYLNSEWRDVRNELTHGLCKKKVEAVSPKELKELVDRGYNSFMIVNKAVSGIKNNHIRKKYKIQ